jgi:large subunit ribosomal protein L32
MRTRLRRTHYKLDMPVISECPRCNKPMLRHHVCRSCGFYRGRLVPLPKKLQPKKT